MSDLPSGRRLVLGLLLGCGGAQATSGSPATDPDHARAAASEVAVAEASSEASGEPGPPAASAAAASEAARLPTQCTPVDGLCLPPRAFVKKLCQDAYSGVALRLLSASSPFTRGYVRSREVKAVNTQGGPSSDQSLRFEEEVLILTHTGGAGANQMVVSGAGGYEVLRWDGTCATLGEGELGTRAPRSPGHAPLAWKYIDSNIQDALMQDPGVAAARRQHRKHCHGVSLGRLSAECAKAESQLGQSIADAVRGGISLPTPERMP